MSQTNNPRGRVPELEPQLEMAVWSVLSEPIDADAVARVQSRARQLTATDAGPCRASDVRERKTNSSRSLRRTLIAATVLVAAAVTGTVLLLDRSAGQALAQVIENVKSASTVQFKMTTRFGRDPEIESRMFLDGNRLRTETFGGTLVQIGDLDGKQALFVDTNRKLAQPTEIDAKLAQHLANPIEQLSHAKTDDAASIGAEVLDGRRTEVYRLTKAGFLGIKGEAEVMLWVDVESQLPKKIVVRDADPKRKMEIQFDEMVWNQPLDAQLFSLEIPAGYQAGVVMPAPSPVPPRTEMASLDAPNVAADGILSRDRVAHRIVWDPQGTTITALMQDPESTQQQRKPNELRQWEVATGKLRWLEEVGGAYSLAVSPDGKTLATAVDYELQLRDMASGEVTKSWETDALLPPLAFSPDGKNLIVGVGVWKKRDVKESGGVQVWDIERGSLLRNIADDKPVTFVDYSTGGRYLASSSNAGPVKMWDAATGELTRLFPGRTAGFSPDGQMIAVVSSSFKAAAKVDLYNLVDGSLLKSLAGAKGANTSWLLWVSFSPDGSLLAAADWDGTVSLWDVATGELKQTFSEHQGGVHVAVFSPDGSTLATGSEDGTLRLRKLPTADKK